MGWNIGSGSSVGSGIVGVSTATKVVPAGYMGEFGNGLWTTYQTPGTYTFTVPTNVSKIRVRVVGAGGGGGTTGSGYGGGGGGGYAHGVFSVTPGNVYTVTIGTGGAVSNPPNAGGSTSFGALLSATGGGAGNASWSAGGTGTGGDFQASGGRGYSVGGGGAAGSQLGNGGDGYSGGGGVGNGTTYGTVGGTAFHSPSNSWGTSGLDITGSFIASGAASAQADVLQNVINAIIRFPFDGFTGGSAYPTGSYTTWGGTGAGGTSAGTSPGWPGVGGGGAYSSTGTGGGIGGGGAGGSSSGGQGGNGLVVVEW